MKLKIDWEKQMGSWAKKPEILEFLNSEYMTNLIIGLIQESEKTTIYPKRNDMFKAFRLCPPDKLKVVILGQDPYHDGSATGLAFANPESKITMSPSLKSIWRATEEVTETIAIDFDHTLEPWAKQGVLLLNTALSVKRGEPASHAKRWEEFTKFIVKYIAENHVSTIFFLWGAHAHKYQTVDGLDIFKNCHVMKHEHPMAARYRGQEWKCNHFKRANEIIEGINGKGFHIKW